MAPRTYRRGFDWPRASWPKKVKPDEGYQCGACLKWFIPKRSDARYCSGACRVAAHRARKAEREREVDAANFYFGMDRAEG